MPPRLTKETALAGGTRPIQRLVREWQYTESQRYQPGQEAGSDMDILRKLRKRFEWWALLEAIFGPWSPPPPTAQGLVSSVRTPARAGGARSARARALTGHLIVEQGSAGLESLVGCVPNDGGTSCRFLVTRGLVAPMGVRRQAHRATAETKEPAYRK